MTSPEVGLYSWRMQRPMVVLPLPLFPMMAVFYVSALLFLVNNLLCLKAPQKIFNYMLACSSLIFFGVSIASIIAFISLYFYEIPTHHCPFDILQKGYYFIGYPIYLCLFGGVFFGFAAGALELGRRKTSLRLILDKTQKKWIRYSIVLTVLFVALCSWGIVSSNLTMTY